MTNKRIGDLIEPKGEFKRLHIREIDQEIDDQTGDILSESYHRRVIVCGNDVSKEDQAIQDLANNLWTQEIKTAWANYQDSLED